MRSDRTWIVIADGAHAKVLEHSFDTTRLEPVEGMTLVADLPPTSDLVTDRPGRNFESVGPTRHAETGRSDPHRELKRGLARKIAAMLAESLVEKRYEHLVLVAPPTALGDMRDALAAPVRARVIAELAKDLVKTPQRELPQHLGDVLSTAGRRGSERRPPAPRGRSKK
jgi:protein required for attachment to host cells